MLCEVLCLGTYSGAVPALCITVCGDHGILLKPWVLVADRGSWKSSSLMNDPVSFRCRHRPNESMCDTCLALDHT